MADPATDPNNLTPDQAAAIVAAQNRASNAQRLNQLVQKNKIFTRMVLALDTALDRTQAIRIGVPFQSIRVESATDSSTAIKFLPLTRDAHQDYAQLGQGDTVTFGFQIADGYLFWDAQPGKTITLILNLIGTFGNGKLVSVNSGGVSINEGSNAPTLNNTALSAGVAAVICPQDANRKVSILQNNTGASIWLGPSTVTNSGSTKGFELQVGGSILWKNTSALYAYSAAGGNVTELEET